MEKVRERIINAALVLFAERGFSNSTSSALAKQAGVAEGTLFRHFRSKDAVLLELIIRVKAQLIRDLTRYLAGQTPKNGLERVIISIQGFYTFASQNTPEFRVIFRDAPAQGGLCDAEVLAEVKGAYSFLIAYLQSAIEEGLRDGSIRQDAQSLESANILLGAVVGLARGLHFQYTPDTPGMAAALSKFCTLALRGKD